MKIVKALSLLSVLGASFQTLAATPPGQCVNGTASGGFGVEGPDFVVAGQSYRYKGDYDWSFPPINDVMEFHNSEDGYVGSDSTDNDSNAYHNMTINNRGSHQAWVISSNNFACSKKSVYSHSAPTGARISISGGNQISASISASIDPVFSKNAVSGDGRPDITYTFNMQQGGGVFDSLTTHSKSINFTPTYSGFYRVSARISDGSTSRTVYLGDVNYTGGINCSFCGPVY